MAKESRINAQAFKGTAMTTVSILYITAKAVLVATITSFMAKIFIS